MAQYPEIYKKKALAELSMEHLGCTMWADDANGHYEPTGGTSGAPRTRRRRRARPTPATSNSKPISKRSRPPTAPEPSTNRSSRCCRSPCFRRGCTAVRRELRHGVALPRAVVPAAGEPQSRQVGQEADLRPDPDLRRTIITLDAKPAEESEGARATADRLPPKRRCRAERLERLAIGRS